MNKMGVQLRNGHLCSDQGRTRVCGEASSVRRSRKPAENADQDKDGHFWMGTN